jgi:hypothetical protein
MICLTLCAINELLEPFEIDNEELIRESDDTLRVLRNVIRLDQVVTGRLNGYIHGGCRRENAADEDGWVASKEAGPPLRRAGSGLSRSGIKWGRREEGREAGDVFTWVSVLAITIKSGVYARVELGEKETTGGVGEPSSYLRSRSSLCSCSRL